MGAAMCTNGRGTNSVNPPVSRCSARAAAGGGPSAAAIRWRRKDRDVGAQPDAVGDPVHLQPSSVVTWSGQMTARISSSDLGVGAGKAGEAGRLEPQQVVAQRLAEPAGALVDLQGGEAVDVHAGHGLAHGLGNVQVVVAVEAGVDAALEGDLGGPALVGLDHPPGHLVQAEQVGLAAGAG